MDIRLMKKEDYDAVYALWLSCTGMGLNDVDDSREGIEKFIDRNPETNFVAEEDGKIVGVIMVGYDGRRAYIHHTAVSPDYRHKGIATKLVETAIEEMKRLGMTKVNLVVFSRNEGGNAFWEKVGFTVRTDLTYRNMTLVNMIRHDT